MKKDLKSAISKYAAFAQDFDNYAGNEFVGGYSNADGQPHVVHHAMPAHGSMTPAPSPNQAQAIPDGADIITFVCSNQNTSGGAVAAILFGADIYGVTNNQPNAGITVIVDESSHAQVRARSQTSPFWVNGIKYFTTTSNQLASQIWTLTKQSDTGETNTIPFRPAKYRTAYQLIQTQVDVPNVKFEINGERYWSIPLIANEQVTIEVQIGGRYDALQGVRGGAPFSIANQNGLPAGVPYTTMPAKQ